MTDSQIIGKRIRSLRQKLNYTQSHVEKSTGIPQSNLSEFENGKLTPQLQTLRKLAKFYKISVSYLLGEVDVEGIKLSIKLLPNLSEEGKKEIQEFIDFVYYKEQGKQ